MIARSISLQNDFSAELYLETANTHNDTSRVALRTVAAAQPIYPS